VNLLTLRPEEIVTSILTYSQEQADSKKEQYILMSTKHGTVKKSRFQDYAHIRINGIIAIRLEPQDELLWVRVSDGKKNVILSSKNGKGIVFKEKEIRSTGRASIGVKGIELNQGDQLISADVFSDDEFKKSVLVIGERGVGKKTYLKFFRGQHRGGKGVKVAAVDKKFGSVAFVQIIHSDDKTLIISSSLGQVVKIPFSSIPARSRSAKGVILMRFSGSGDKVVGATFV